jgi:hypothetical protein
MMLAAQESALRAFVVAAVADSDLDPIPLERVVWGPSNNPPPVKPYVLLGDTGTARLGAGGNSRTRPTGEVDERTDKTTEISITFVSTPSETAPTRDQTARAYVREVEARLYHAVIGPILSDADMGLADINITANVDRLQGRSQWETRAVLDLTFNHALVVTASPGTIESLTVVANTNPATEPTESTITS